MGVISIPKMDVDLPIFLVATYDNMAAGAVRLSQTSLSIGGPDTNCMIAAHRGWYGAPNFRYIDLLKVGTRSISQTYGKRRPMRSRKSRS